jgi:hypothetical protein
MLGHTVTSCYKGIALLNLVVKKLVLKSILNNYSAEKGLVEASIALLK